MVALLFIGGMWPKVGMAGLSACEDLAAKRWGNFRIHVAERRAAANGQPAHCFVRGTIDTEINFEVWLPLPRAWNGRFVMGGGIGFGGTVQNQAFNFAPNVLHDGFATAGTDTGHKGPGTSASWALNRVDRTLNFGHRAVHLTTQAAKTIVRVYYGQDITYAYFLGCSRGGGQGMMASQRYPDDFDGIVAGAPAFNWGGIGAQYIQNIQAMYPDPVNRSTPVVRPATQRLLASAILAACDDLDGLADGILNDPRVCTFKPDDLPRCQNDVPGARCVTSSELTAIKTIYAGPSVNGKRLHPGFPFGGESEAGVWGAWMTGQENGAGAGYPNLQFAVGVELFKYIFLDDPDWDYASYDFADWADDTRAGRAVLDATNTDLTHFNVAGGKILYWSGWTDGALTALGIIDYFEKMQQQNAHAADFSRLFLLPGVHHCAEGPGPDTVDWLRAIQAWVEENKPPDTLLATKREKGTVVMQRPICAYPAHAVYTGTGDGSEADHFRCTPDSSR